MLGELGERWAEKRGELGGEKLGELGCKQEIGVELGALGEVECLVTSDEKFN